MFEGLAALESNLDYHRDRHAVLAGNLANADTPGYQPLDLTRPEAPAALGPLVATDPRHIGASGALAGGGEIVETPGPDGHAGNAVSMERELAKLDANRVRYMAASSLVSRRLALLKYTAGDGT